METCAISIQSCLSHFMGSKPSTSRHPQRGEGTTQVITGAVKLTYNLGQQLQHISHCILQNSTTAGILRPTGNYPLHTRSWPGSDLLCEDGTTDFICTKREGSDGTTRGYSQLHPFIVQEDFPTGGRWLQQYIFLTSNASDDFTKSSFYKINCLSRTQGFIMLGHNF